MAFRWWEHELHELPPDTLSVMAEQGLEWIEFFCGGCRYLILYGIDKAMERFGRDVRLIDISRVAKCRRCGHRGPHVQPRFQPAYGRSRREDD